MHKINKILITSIISLGCFFGISLADDSDCGIFAIQNFSKDSPNSFPIVTTVRGKDDYIYSKFLPSEIKNKIIDVDSLNTAVLNLKKYCCENKLGGLNQNSNTCKDDKEFFNNNVPDSPYLFYHILDVMIRRLNGLDGEYNIYTKTNMTLDDLGSEWRIRISQKAEDLSGSDIESISNKYESMRKPTAEYDITMEMNAQFGNASNSDFLSYTVGSGGAESEKIANVFKNYENRTLYDRYHNACATTEYLYALLNSGKVSKDKEKIRSDIANGYCSEKIRKLIGNQSNYVSLVAQQAGNRYLNNYIDGYMSYLSNRRNTLEDTRRNSTHKFLDVVKGVPHLVKKCVK